MTKEDLKSLGLNDEQLSALEKGFEEYEKEIEKITTEAKEKELHYEDKIKHIKIENQVNNALLSAGAKNIKAVKALIDLDNMEFDGEKLLGLEDSIRTLSQAEDTSFLFNQKTENQSFKGFTAGNSQNTYTDKKLEDMTYTELENYYARVE